MQAGIARTDEQAVRLSGSQAPGSDASTMQASGRKQASSNKQGSQAVGVAASALQTDGHLVADILMTEVPHVVLLHVLIAQPSCHDQPPSTAAQTHSQSNRHSSGIPIRLYKV